MKISYECENDECEHEFEITFYHATPDTGMSGRWEDAEQGSPRECSPSECPQCGTEVDLDEVEEACGEDVEEYNDDDR